MWKCSGSGLSLIQGPLRKQLRCLLCVKHACIQLMHHITLLLLIVSCVVCAATAAAVWRVAMPSTSMPEQWFCLQHNRLPVLADMLASGAQNSTYIQQDCVPAAAAQCNGFNSQSCQLRGLPAQQHSVKARSLRNATGTRDWRPVARLWTLRAALGGSMRGRPVGTEPGRSLDRDAVVGWGWGHTHTLDSVAVHPSGVQVHHVCR